MAGIITKVSRVVGTAIRFPNGKRQTIQLMPVVINFVADEAWELAKKQSKLIQNLMQKGLIQDGAKYTKEQAQRQQLIQDELDKDIHRLDKPKDGAADITGDNVPDGVTFEGQQEGVATGETSTTAPVESADITEADDDLLD